MTDRRHIFKHVGGRIEVWFFAVNPWSIRRMDRFVSEIAAAVGAPMHIILGAPLICNETTLVLPRISTIIMAV